MAVFGDGFDAIEVFEVAFDVEGIIVAVIRERFWAANGNDIDVFANHHEGRAECLVHGFFGKVWIEGDAVVVHAPEWLGRAGFVDDFFAGKTGAAKVGVVVGELSIAVLVIIGAAARRGEFFDVRVGVSVFLGFD